jgi:hypothetical protein
MRLQQILLASVLTFVSFVLAQDAERWASVAQKTRTNVIVLNDQTFDELITAERNYTSVGTISLTTPLTGSGSHGNGCSVSMFFVQGI